MTIYIKQMLEQVREKYGTLPNDELVHRLIEIGVIDFRLCKILAIRQYVYAAVKAGTKKYTAMFKAAEQFCCTYEYVRKCMYYYKDINL